MKLLSVEDAQTHLAAICEEALAGEVIRLQLANGRLLELRAVRAGVLPPKASAEEVAQCYSDEDWAAFENDCAKASD